MIVPILALILFGVVELGMMLRAGLELNSMAREATRSLSAGEATGVVNLRIADEGTNLERERLAIVMEFRPYLGSGTWASSWQPVSDSGGENAVPTHAQVRATLDYDHVLMMPGLFRFLTDDPETGSRRISASVVMLRT